MRKALWTLAALVLLLSGATLLWGAGAQAATSTVTMGSDAEPNAFKFFPAEISIPVGSTVRWQNKSDIPHDATADNGSFKSDQLSKGGTFEFQFTSPGEFSYFCSVSGHKDAGMQAVVKVVGGASTPTTVATTTTTAATGGTTTTTASGSTTTTAKAAGGSSTTSTTAAAGGATTTTLAPALTPTSAPEGATAASTATQAGSEEAAADHSGEGTHKKKEEKNSPIGIAFALVSTLLLVGIAGKLLASKP